MLRFAVKLTVTPSAVSDADVEALKARGVEFVSEPVLLSPPDAPPARFVCFKDPDGTILELVETAQP